VGVVTTLKPELMVTPGTTVFDTSPVLGKYVIGPRVASADVANADSRRDMGARKTCASHIPVPASVGARMVCVSV
jgi:hypothetical protein